MYAQLTATHEFEIAQCQPKTEMRDFVDLLWDVYKK